MAERLSLADLDACFDDAAVLRHAPEVIARLHSLETAIAARKEAPHAAR